MKILGKSKHIKFVTLIFTALMISSVFFAVSSDNSTVKASTTTISSNMLQYEWPRPSADDANTYSVAGPAPSTPNIQWSKTFTEEVGYYLAAFNGMFFTQGDATYAMNAATGQIIWTAYVYGSIAKIDDTYMMVGSTCLNIATGQVAWKGPAGFSPNWSGWVGGAGYVPELKMFLSADYGWSLPDSSKPPVLVWNNTGNIEGGAYWGTVGYYGDGKVFYCLGDGQLHAISATTGKPIWQVGTEEPEGWTFGAVYHDGILYHGEQGGDKFNAWNTTNGQLIWQYSASTFYGM